MAIVRVQAADFDTTAELRGLGEGRRDIGGVGAFVGTVRGTAQGRAIVSMTLEHYPGMTERALLRIAAEAEARWALMGCTLVHRVGLLRPGENIVLVLAAAAHRHAALEATSFLIDWLKTAAPFWKKERFETGEEAWVDAREADTEAVARWGR